MFTPEENRLPIIDKDEDLSLGLRIYVPDADRMETRKPPVAEKITVLES
ncbi:MAG: hypothetical protein LJE93_05310 [Acidobacteria bacterium]|jgi:hypothetical protein|nr:hypothetical protein [Acidobacteriota bacterium]